MVVSRDPRLPTDMALCSAKNRGKMNLKEYGIYIADKLSEAWILSKTSVGKAQKRQKTYYDRKARPPNFAVGERVFLLKPAERTGEGRKLARPFHGPYRVVEISSNDAHIRRVDRPQDEPILVALDRLRRCPEEIPDEFWPKDKKSKRYDNLNSPPQDVHVPSDKTGSDPIPSDISPVTTPPVTRAPNQWTGRLRHNRLRTAKS